MDAVTQVENKIPPGHSIDRAVSLGTNRVQVKKETRETLPTYTARALSPHRVRGWTDFLASGMAAGANTESGMRNTVAVLYI
jgi:hypothetical protein